MSSLVLQQATRYLMPLLLLFSLFLFARGHNEPGGGFVGGLAASAAFALLAISAGVRRARDAARINPSDLMGIGIALAALSGLPAMFLGAPYMTSLWSSIKAPVLGKIGTPTLFDLGVYLVVVGVVLTFVFELIEE